MNGDLRWRNAGFVSGGGTHFDQPIRHPHRIGVKQSGFRVDRNPVGPVTDSGFYDFEFDVG